MKKERKKQSGFTLIELLVVIAIIGVLASIVLAGLNTARTRARDVSIKANLSQSRHSAELYQSENGNYGTAGGGTGVCGDTGDNTVGRHVAEAINQSSKPEAYDTVAETCFVMTNGSAWAASVPLSTGFYCVDSSGSSKETETFTISASDAEC